MDEPVEILLVEDNPNDVRLTVDALRHHNLGNHIQVARDGEEALEFLFCIGRFCDRKIDEQPKVVFLDLEAPVGRWSRSAPADKGRPQDA